MDLGGCPSTLGTPLSTGLIDSSHTTPYKQRLYIWAACVLGGVALRTVEPGAGIVASGTEPEELRTASS